MSFLSYLLIPLALSTYCIGKCTYAIINDAAYVYAFWDGGRSRARKTLDRGGVFVSLGKWGLLLILTVSLLAAWPQLLDTGSHRLDVDGLMLIVLILGRLFTKPGKDKVQEAVSSTGRTRIASAAAWVLAVAVLTVVSTLIGPAPDSPGANTQSRKIMGYYVDGAIKTGLAAATTLLAPEVTFGLFTLAAVGGLAPLSEELARQTGTTN